MFSQRRSSPNLGRIQKLPESLIRLIAAGEVIERPASVVKELVENSIDAGATRIAVDLMGAGRQRIRIADDGVGMSADDALLALDRHATSKLRSFDDLQNMETFGFRGEALPSIAAVSRLELHTRPREAPQGWTLKLEGGVLQSKTASGMPPGTTIDVQDLFFNTPARSKFLKRDSTERSHVLKTLQEIALAHPSIRFDVSMEGKSVLSLTATKELGQRIADLWGLSLTEQLVALDVTQGPCRIHGFVNAVSAHHPTKTYQALYVNARPVQQRMLTHAIVEAYREWLPVGRHPVFVLFIELDPSLVDVNVHPTKREVRISNERAVYELLFEKIRSLFKSQTSSTPPHEYKPFDPSATSSPSSFSKQESHQALAMQSPLETFPFDSFSSLPETASLVADAPSGMGGKQDIRVHGQFQKLYLLIEQQDTLVIIDQHAAAERVLYEKLLHEVSCTGVPRQALLSPLIWDTTPAQAEAMRNLLPDLEHMGFGLTAFGANSFALKEWPAVLPESKEAKRFLEEMAEAFAAERPTDRTQIQHQIAARAACRAAIMAGDSVSTPEAVQLWKDLGACERPMTCPHGRPTHIRFPKSELDRRFRRS